MRSDFPPPPISILELPLILPLQVPVPVVVFLAAELLPKSPRPWFEWRFALFEPAYPHGPSWPHHDPTPILPYPTTIVKTFISLNQ